MEDRYGSHTVFNIEYHFQDRENNPGFPAFSTTCVGWPFCGLCGIRLLNNSPDGLRCVRPEEKKCGNGLHLRFLMGLIGHNPAYGR